MIRKGFLVLSFWLCGCAAGLAAEKPNIVVILADDVGINDLACYGREDHATPHLDQLAAQGVRFTAAYAAAPTAMPARAALLTGKAPARLRLTTDLPDRPAFVAQRMLAPQLADPAQTARDAVGSEGFKPVRPPGPARSKVTPKPAALSQEQIARKILLAEKTVAELLKAAGYASGYFGRWPLGAAGFDAIESGFDAASEENGDAHMAAAEQFMETNKARPFFLLVSPAPAAPAALPEGTEGAFNPRYAAHLEALDAAVGQLLAKLETLGIAERTLVVFTSTNGGRNMPAGDQPAATQNTPYRAGKGFVFEGGLRIPLLVRWPGRVTSGTLCTAAVISMDWLPTWLAAAGAPVEPGLDGVDLAPLFAAGGELAKRALCWHIPHYSAEGGRPAGAIRDGDFKLIEHYEDGGAELFDLASDPGERADQSAAQPEKAADLRGKLAAWRQSVRALENTPNPLFDPNLAQPIYGDLDVSNLEPAATAAELGETLAAWIAAMEAASRPAMIATRARPVILLPARTAKIRGTALRYEPAPEKNSLGFWTKVEDSASWDFDVKSAGEYSVEVLQGSKGIEGAEVSFSFGGQMLAMVVEPTGHFQNFKPRVIGRVRLAAGKNTLIVQPKTKPGDAVMDLRQVVLVPPVLEVGEKDEPQ